MCNKTRDKECYFWVSNLQPSKYSLVQQTIFLSSIKTNCCLFSDLWFSHHGDGVINFLTTFFSYIYFWIKLKVKYIMKWASLSSSLKLQFEIELCYLTLLTTAIILKKGKQFWGKFNLGCFDSHLQFKDGGDSLIT